MKMTKKKNGVSMGLSLLKYLINRMAILRILKPRNEDINKESIPEL